MILTCLRLTSCEVAPSVVFPTCTPPPPSKMKPPRLLPSPTSAPACSTKKASSPCVLRYVLSSPTHPPVFHPPTHPPTHLLNKQGVEAFARAASYLSNKTKREDAARLLAQLLMDEERRVAEAAGWAFIEYLPMEAGYYER